MIIVAILGILVAGCGTRHSMSPVMTPSPSAKPTALNLPVLAWWGGPSYYSRFPHAVASGWTKPSRFPIAVFMGKPEQAPSLKAIGINTLMGVEHDGSDIETVTDNGLSVLAQLEWTPKEVGSNQLVVGWSLSDECDMGYSNCGPDEKQAIAKQTMYAKTARQREDGRFLHANFGNGVLKTHWAITTMDDHVALVDVTSVDKYAYTSPHVRDLITQSPSWPQGVDPATSGAYGWLQDQMESFMTPPASKPNWVFVETARPYLTEKGARTIIGREIRGAAWSAIIHGAAGIAYFQHNNSRGCGTYSLVDCPDSRDAVAMLNGEIQSLAPVLNSQPYDWSFGEGLVTSLRAFDGHGYILAMAEGEPGSRRFALPPELSGSPEVEVVGEGRSIRIAGGGFSDAFDGESSYHIYRVPVSPQ